MQYLVVILYLTALHATFIVYAFRDYPANYLNQSTMINNDFDSISRNIPRNTIYEKSFTNTLARKKRGFVFFKGAVVVLTQVLSKAILATTPRGVLQSTEVDMFYDLPILIEGWKKPLVAFVNRTKGAKKSDVVNVDFIEDGKIGVINNASSVSWDKYYKTSNKPNFNPIISYNRNNWNRYNSNYSKPYHKGLSSSNYYYSYPNYHRRNNNQIRYQNKNSAYQKQFKQYPLQNKHPIITKPQKSKQQRLKHVNSVWHEHREYRERRGIFNHVEAFGQKLGISLRSCILRAICEMKTELLPEGESFINDVARILFTIPTNHDNKDDDFVQMALDDGVDCVRRFMVSCPHSPLKYIFNNFRATNLPPMSEEDMLRNVMYA